MSVNKDVMTMQKYVDTRQLAHVSHHINIGEVREPMHTVCADKGYDRWAGGRNLLNNFELLGGV